MVRMEVTIISTALKVISVLFFIAQVAIAVLNIGSTGPFIWITILTGLLISLAGYGFGIAIDLLAGIELALKKRSTAKPKVEDWQAHPPAKSYNE